MCMCGQSGHTPLVYTAACHAARRDPDWTMPDALYRGRAGCSSFAGSRRVGRGADRRVCIDRCHQMNF